MSPSPTSDDRLRHQREHRELLVVQPQGPPEAATGLFRGLRASLRRAKDLDLLRRQRQENSPGKLPGSHGGPRRGPGQVRHGVQPRSAVERNLLRDERPLLLDELQISSSNIGAQGGGVDMKHLLGLSPDLPATIKCRYNDVKVPAETFRIITVRTWRNSTTTWTTWQRFALRTSCSKSLSGALARLKRSLTRTRARC